MILDRGRNAIIAGFSADSRSPTNIFGFPRAPKWELKRFEVASCADKTVAMKPE